MSLKRTTVKREADFQIITGWIESHNRVLDLGCGRGILLEHLKNDKDVYGVGVDVNLDKVKSCVKRGVPVYQGDAESILNEFDDAYFDWVILSRTLQELIRPGRVIREALRVGRNLAVSFVNHGFWRNRASVLLTGSRIRNEVFPQSWDESPPINQVTVHDFEAFCDARGIHRAASIYLGGDWRTPCRRFPNIRAGYALYHLTSPNGPVLE